MSNGTKIYGFCEAGCRYEVANKEDLIEFAGSTLGLCRIAYVTYTGTGEHGAEHPCRIESDFTPIIIFKMGSNRGGFISALDFNALPEEYTHGAGFGEGTPYGRRNGNAVEWYSNSSAEYQYNKKDTVYAFLILG